MIYIGDTPFASLNRYFLLTRSPSFRRAIRLKENENEALSSRWPQNAPFQDRPHAPVKELLASFTTRAEKLIDELPKG